MTERGTVTDPNARRAQVSDARPGMRRTANARSSASWPGNDATVTITTSWQREYRRENREAERSGHLRRTFGLTLEEYEQLLAAQGGRCAICRSEPGKISLHVDHDHETGKVRGLLCFRCNGGAGQFKEDVELLARAIDYLDSGGLVEAIELERRARERARELAGASR
jgi:hypothetical protein